MRVSAYVLTASGGQVSDRGKGPTFHNGSAGWLSSPIERVSPAAGWAAGSLPLLHSWNYSALPSWDTHQVLDVVLDYGATPQWMDAGDDDGAKI